MCTLCVVGWMEMLSRGCGSLFSRVSTTCQESGQKEPSLTKKMRKKSAEGTGSTDTGGRWDTHRNAFLIIRIGRKTSEFLPYYSSFLEMEIIDKRRRKTL